jgi:hypothetical protein
LLWCLGFVLLFAWEQGRRRNRLDFTRRWGVLGSYVVLAIMLVDVMLIWALVATGIAALLQSLPPENQPWGTTWFAEFGYRWLRYGPYPTDAAVTAVCCASALTGLLACRSIAIAMTATGTAGRRVGYIVIAPLMVVCVASLLGAASSAMGGFQPSLSLLVDLVDPRPLLFRPDLVVDVLEGNPLRVGNVFQGRVFGMVHVTVLPALLVAAVWLSTAQIRALGRRFESKRTTAESADA